MGLLVALEQVVVEDPREISEANGVEKVVETEAVRELEIRQGSGS